MSPAVRPLAAACLSACLLAPGSAAAAGAAAAGLAVRIAPDTVRANEDGFWQLGVKLVNGSAYGVFGDSLALLVSPAGGSAPEVPLRLLLPAGAESISAGDSVVTQVSVNPVAREARLEVRFFAHDRTGAPLHASAAAAASGSVLDERYPPARLRAGGRAAEIVKVPASGEAAGGAGVLLLPGEGSDAASMLVPASRLARAGVAVVIVNAPGRGGSEGPDDFAGPASRAAALAGLDTLLAMPGVDRARIGAWGVSRGATLALALALERPGAFAAVAAQSACYDLWAAHRAAPPEGRAGIEAAAGRDSAAWRGRSPLLRAAAPGPPALVYHGDRDAVFPAAGARSFAAAAAAAGRTVVMRFLPAGGHDLPPVEPVRFLQSRLSAPR